MRWPTSLPTCSTAGATRVAASRPRKWPKRASRPRFPQRRPNTETRDAIAMAAAMILPRLGLLLAALAAPAFAADYASLPGGAFASVLPADANSADVKIAAFRLRREPVTNAEFLAFIKAHTEWRRDRVASVFAEARYLAQWSTADTLGPEAKPDQPVTQVSWFAAQAFCASK